MADNAPPTDPSRKEKRIERDENRGQWKSNSEFILSLLGYAIGIGNVWRFPYLCYRSGGAAFLIPYLLMVILAGIPLFYMEVLIGQFSGTGCTGMFRMTPLLKGTGIAQVVVNAYCVCYYSVIISYPIRMISYCFFKKVPWEDCKNPWNTDRCVVGDAVRKFNRSEDFQTAADQFFHREVLKISSGISEIGGMVWQQLVSLLITWIIIYLCLIRGIKSVGKVVYFTVPFPYVLLFILFVRGVTLPGAWTGIKFYLYPEWVRLLDLKVWADAAIQMFFGLGPGWGGIINMASFNNFRNNPKYDSVLIVSINVFTSVFAGFVVFSVLGFLSEKSGIPVDRVATGGAGLAFVTYPEAIAMMPVPQLWSLMFFLMLFLLGIDSVFVQLEAIMSSILDEWLWARQHKYKLTLISCLTFFGLSTLMCTNGGMYILQLLDWYSSAIAVIVICLVEIIMVSYIYGIKNFLLDVEFMLGKRPSLMWKISWQIVTPIILVFILITSIVFIRSVTYNNVSYPHWAIAIGWLTFVSSVIWIPLYIFYIMIRKRTSIRESLKKRLKPLDWTPADPQYRAEYEAFRKQRRMPGFMSETDIESTK
ncbi:sodium- and chloride-dependent glycine transporter 1 isoform X1 [Drosophila eugracilis]|uniref:sodium- and chloride-dependent glycine transporter 1 isoform X1 n=1 Tax=Drosophila eugracilis TaxID=29029 RepID=UPI0007E758DD|nr:sodium- and chloride-dependent glycine transporter 1 isoform X1 [Drosophila eugracilis]